jgi:hypothetical protein
MKLAAGASPSKGLANHHLRECIEYLRTPDGSKYPQAAAIIQPVKRPITTAQDFIIGEPNRSQRMMVMNTEKPSPMNSADPHGRGFGARIVGQSRKSPSVGRVLQVPDPPAQS